MALELSPADFAAAIGVKPAELSTLERAGLPFVNRKKDGHVYPLPAAVRWYVEREIVTRVGGIPPRTSQKEIAMLSGYSARQIATLVDEGIVKTVVENGKRSYPLPAAMHEILAHKESQARGKTTDKLSSLDAAKLRKLEADAQDSELNLQERRGELLDRPLVERAVGDLFQGLKAQLVQFTSRYEADFVGLESRLKVRQVLKPAIAAELLRLQAAVSQVARRIQTIDATAEPDDAGDADDAGEDDVRHAS